MRVLTSCTPPLVSRARMDSYRFRRSATSLQVSVAGTPFKGDEYSGGASLFPPEPVPGSSSCRQFLWQRKVGTVPQGIIDVAVRILSQHVPYPARSFEGDGAVLLCCIEQ